MNGGNELGKGAFGEGVPGRGNSKCKGPEVGTSFAYLKAGNERGKVRHWFGEGRQRSDNIEALSNG